MPDPVVLLVAAAGVFLISFMKGAFGGGFAVVGIPLLSLTMDPITAGGVLAPIFVAMDLFALRYWKPSTWSKPELLLLAPGLFVGMGLGFALLSVVSRPFVAIMIAVTTLGFAAHWFLGSGIVTPRPRSTALGLAAGAASGFTSMVAHSGGPPVVAYLLSRGLPKAIYAGTISAFFTMGNIAKAAPWVMLAQPSREVWLLMAMLLPVAPLGVIAGWRLHQRLDQRQMTRLCYLLLTATSLKLLWDGLKGYGLI